MQKVQHRKRNYRELGFVPIHTKVRRETHRPCSQCGKWIYVVELGFCRYRFVEYSYSVEGNAAPLPWAVVVRRCTNHICVNAKDNPQEFRMNYVQKRIISEMIATSRAKNNNRLYNNRQNNRDGTCIIPQKQDDGHRMKPILMETL